MADGADTAQGPQLTSALTSDWDFSSVTLPGVTLCSGNGTVFPIGMDPSMVISLIQPPSLTPDESGYDSKAAQALYLLEDYPAFKSITMLIKQAFEILDAFKCNVAAAKTFKIQVQKVAHLFGQKYYGLAFHAKYIRKTVDASHLFAVEAALSRSIRYLKRFTLDDYLTQILVGKDPQVKFMECDQQLTDAVNEVLKAFGFVSSSYLVSAPNYVVVCDVKPTAEAAVADIQTVNKMMDDMGITGADKESFLSDLDVFNKYASSLRTSAEILVLNQPQNVIKSNIIKQFWTSKIGPNQTVALATFCSLLSEYLSETGAQDPEGTANNMKTALKIQLGIKDTDYLECLDVAKLVRYIEPSDSSVFAKVIDMSTTRCKRILPPAPTVEITWDQSIQGELTKLTSTRGWANLYGPKYSGKSTRLLSVMHSFGGEKDVLWIDFSKAQTEMEFVSRFTSQLYLRNSVFKEDIVKSVRDLLRSLRAGSIVVFDNIDDSDVESKVMSSFKSFTTNMANLVAEFEAKLCIIVVSTVSLNTFGLFTQKLVMTPLSDEAATSLASALLPVDPDSLKKAGANLPGLMSILAQTSSLGTIREVCRSWDAKPGDLAAVEAVIAEGNANELTNEESLCASCLLRGLAPFDASVGWDLSKTVFGDDIVRWFIAWQGLARMGWFNFSSDLGYIIPANAMVPGTCTVTATAQGQWDIYINHWALEAARLNTASQETTSSLEYFDCNRAHFKSLFGSFFPDETTQALSAVEPVAKILAGNIGRLLKYRFSPSSAVALARRVYERLDADTTQPLAAADLAVQLQRYDDSAGASAAIQDAMAKLSADDVSFSRGKVLAVAGYVAHSQGRRREALKSYTQALEVWDSLGLNATTCFEYAETQAWQQQVTCSASCTVFGGIFGFPFVKMA